MHVRSLSHLDNQTVRQGLIAAAARDCATTTELLAYIAEFDARKLYRPEAYPSTFEYCVHELHMSEDIALTRIRVARAAQEFPAIFAAIAEGRLHLTAVVMLAPRLTAETADELLAAASHQTVARIKQLLAQRFPQPDVPTRIRALSGSAGPAPQAELVSKPVDGSAGESVSGPPEFQLVSKPVEAPAPRPNVAPLSPERYSLQLTMSQQMHDKLRHAQALLGHQVPSGDVAQVLERALDVLIGKLEQRKFGATSRPRPGRGSSGHGRHIPAEVRRAVRARDQGQCTFTSDTGHRCGATKFLEFDHIDPVARGGRATVEGLRLRCRVHNQYEAERVFGAGFMSEKRERARHAAAVRRTEADHRAAQACEAQAAAVAEHEMRLDVINGLTNLGFRADEARRAAEQCDMPGAPIEDRLRATLSRFAQVRGVRRVDYRPPP